MTVSRDVKINRVNILILSLIGAYVLGCGIFWLKFAKLHLTIPGINLPLFPGEVILLCCGILHGWYRLAVPRPWTRVDAFLVVYLMWLVLKVITGFASGGNLAFRHAALFYYPLFAVFSFYAAPAILKIPQIGHLILFAAIVLLKIAGTLEGYYTYPALILLGVLIVIAPSRILKVCMGLAVLVIFPFKELLQDSKSLVIGNVTAIFFVLTVLMSIYIRSKKYLILALPGLMLLLGVFLISYGPSLHQKSLKSWKTYIDVYKQKDALIQFKYKTHEANKLKVRLFNKNGLNYAELEALESKFDKQAVEKPSLNDIRSAYMVSIKYSKVVVAKAQEQMIHAEQAHSAVKEVKKENDALLSSAAVEEKNPVVSKGRDQRPKQQIKKVNEAPITIYKTPNKEVVDEIKRDTEVMESYVTKIESGEQLTEEQIKDSQQIMEKLGANIQTLDQGIITVGRSVETDGENILFRVFIWRDMIKEFLKHKPIFGFSLSYPQRSTSIEILDMAHGEWMRDGWIAPHNSYLHFIYRGGIVGLVVILLMWGGIIYLIRTFIKCRHVVGLLAVSLLVYWCVLANFNVVFEFPYHAIAFWSLFGVLLAMAGRKPLESRVK